MGYTPQVIHRSVVERTQGKDTLVGFRAQVRGFSCSQPIEKIEKRGWYGWCIFIKV